MPPLLNPKLDVVFKLLFAHQDSKSLLISLLTAVLHPASTITDVLVLNPDIDKEAIEDRGITLDILVELCDKRHIDVEMQIAARSGWLKRMLYHWARMFSSNISRGDLFPDLAPCVSVFILGYDGLQEKQFHTIMKIVDLRSHKVMTDALELHVLELPNLLNHVDDNDGLLANWGRFLSVQTEEELEVLAMKGPEFAEAESLNDR